MQQQKKEVEGIELRTQLDLPISVKEYLLYFDLSEEKDWKIPDGPFSRLVSAPLVFILLHLPV